MSTQSAEPNREARTEPDRYGDVPSLGSCCVCGRPDGVTNIILLDKRQTEEGTGGWGCLQCGLPQAGAVAVLCDRCMDANAEPKFACVGYPSENRRVPIEQLTEPFEHDMAKHSGE